MVRAPEAEFLGDWIASDEASRDLTSEFSHGSDSEDLRL